MLPLGTTAPDFNCRTQTAKQFRWRIFAASRVLVMFICNHCPYVKHIRAGLAQIGRDYQSRVGIVGINSNDVENYPDDSPAKMKEEAKSAGYTFPYLYDESQAVAKRLSRRLHAGFLFCSMQIINWFIAANWMTAVREMACRSPEKICAPRSTPCLPANSFRPIKKPAWVATSNGKAETSRIISDYFFGSFSSTISQRTCMSNLWPS